MFTSQLICAIFLTFISPCLPVSFDSRNGNFEACRNHQVKDNLKRVRLPVNVLNLLINTILIISFSWYSSQVCSFRFTNNKYHSLINTCVFSSHLLYIIWWKHYLSKLVFWCRKYLMKNLIDQLSFMNSLISE